jgi:integral membrane protein
VTTRRIDPQAATSALARFRVGATLEGIALLILVVIMVMEYVVHGGPTPFSTLSPTWAQISTVWSPIHGLIYMLYVVTAFGLWSRMKWPLPVMLLLMLFGVVPVLSFIGENWAAQRVRRELDAQESRVQSAG